MFDVVSPLLISVLFSSLLFSSFQNQLNVSCSDLFSFLLILSHLFFSVMIGHFLRKSCPLAVKQCSILQFYIKIFEYFVLCLCVHQIKVCAAAVASQGGFGPAAFVSRGDDDC